MKKFLAGALLLSLVASMSSAQVVRYKTPSGTHATAETGEDQAISAAHPLPVTATSSALPTGAATAAKQDTGNTSLGSIDTKLTSQATAAKQDTAQSSLSSLVTNTTDLATSAKQDTAQTSLSSIVANTAASSTAANQTSANTKLDSIITNTTNIATSANQTTNGTKLDTLHTDNGASGSGITQPTAGSGILGWLSGIYKAATGTGTASMQVQGSVAASAAVGTNNPFLMGVSDASGNAKVVQSPPALADGGQLSTGLPVAGFGYNGSTWDKLRNILGAVAAGNVGTGTLAVEEAGRKFANITTATTTTVKSGAGFLHTLVINTPLGSGVVTMYDNTAGSGTKIGTITLPATLLNDGPLVVTYDVAFSTGLTIVTVAGQDITVSYR